MVLLSRIMRTKYVGNLGEGGEWENFGDHNYSAPQDFIGADGESGPPQAFKSEGCCCQFTHQHGLLIDMTNVPHPLLCYFAAPNVVSCYLFSVLPAIV